MKYTKQYLRCLLTPTGGWLKLVGEGYKSLKWWQCVDTLVTLVTHKALCMDTEGSVFSSGGSKSDGATGHVVNVVTLVQTYTCLYIMGYRS